jgi:hypothetical protein
MQTRLESIRRLATRWLTLIFAPVAVSLATIIVTNVATSPPQPVPWWLWAVTGTAAALAVLLYLIGYTTSFENLLHRASMSLRSYRYRKPRVLIFDGTINGGPAEITPTPIQSDRIPADWRAACEALGWQVDMGPVNRILRKPAPDIVINPFGELYPEADFNTNGTVIEIRKYVWEGGVFANVAGLPFWYRYNPSSGKYETAARVEKVADDKFGWKYLIYDLFPTLSIDTSFDPKIVECRQGYDDIRRFGDVASAGGKQTVNMFRAYNLKPPLLIPLLKDSEQQHCIIGGLEYGDGCFLFAGVQIDRDDKSFDKVIAAVKGWVQYEVRFRKPVSN